MWLRVLNLLTYFHTSPTYYCYWIDSKIDDSVLDNFTDKRVCVLCVQRGTQPLLDLLVKLSQQDIL